MEEQPFNAVPRHFPIQFEIAIFVVAQDWMADVGCVHADLMGPPCQQPRLDLGLAFAHRKGLELGDRAGAVCAS